MSNTSNTPNIPNTPNTPNTNTSSHAVTVLTEENRAQYLTANTNAIIDFSARWCGPCKRMEPVFEKEAKRMQDLAADLKLDLKFLKVDVDDFEALASEYSIHAMPTVVILKDGKEVFRNLGSMND